MAAPGSRPPHDHAPRVLRARQHLEGHLGQRGERAVGAGHELGEVVAGDVLHHLAAGLEHLAAAVDRVEAEQVVARRPGLDPPRAGEVAGRRRRRSSAGAPACRAARASRAARRRASAGAPPAPPRSPSSGVAARGGEHQLGRLVARRCRESRDRSSRLLACIGRPRPRLVPPPTSSSGCSSATAQATTSQPSFALAGENTATAAASRSEPRQVGEPDLPAMDVHPAEFGAAVQLREHLARVEQPLRVEGAFEPLLLGEVGLVEHRRPSGRASRRRRRARRSARRRPRRRAAGCRRRTPRRARARPACWRRRGSADAGCRRRRGTRWRRRGRTCRTSRASAPAPSAGALRGIVPSMQ